MIKEDGKAQFHRLPYLSDRGQSFYLDLLILRANARLQKIPLFKAFLTAIRSHTLSPNSSYNPIVPMREDEDDDEIENNAECEDEVINGDEDVWFIYPEDVTYEEDSGDEDYVP